MKLQPIKITQFFGTGTGYGKVKKARQFFIPRKRKECVPEFKTLADYVVPRNYARHAGTDLKKEISPSRMRKYYTGEYYFVVVKGVTFLRILSQLLEIYG